MSDRAITATRDEAVQQAFHTDRRRLLDFIRRRVKRTEDAEDILQDVFYQLLTGYNVAEPIEQLTAWLFKAARNKVIDWYRKRKPEPLSEIVEDVEGPLQLEEILFDPTQNPDDLYMRSLVWSELAEALEDLPEKQREVFIMHELEGKSFREMAELTGESINTLLSRKRYAVLLLREKLDELYKEFNTL